MRGARIIARSPELRLRILFLTPRFWPDRGGVERHVLRLSQELIKDGHQVSVLVKIARARKVPQLENHGGVRIIRIRRNRLRGMEVFSHRFLSALLRESDVIHCHDHSTFGWIAPLLPILAVLRRRTYVTFHGWEGRCPPLRRVVFLRKVTEWLTRGNLCVGDYIAKWYGTKPAKVIYGGVDPCQESDGAGEFYLYSGRLSEDVGIFAYLCAWNELTRTVTGLRPPLVICGDGPLRKECERYVDQNGLSNVRFEGMVPDVMPYLARAKAVMTTGYLGMLEAFACGKQVIAFYGNRLKRDYLMMMPDAQSAMIITGSTSEIVAALTELESQTNVTDNASGRAIASSSSWQHIKRAYHDVWNI